MWKDRGKGGEIADVFFCFFVFVPFRTVKQPDQINLTKDLVRNGS